MSLAELTALEEDASYLEGAIRDSLDDEWIPQACHAEIGKEVAKIYLSARRERGVDDLNSLLVDWGTGLTGFSGMGDAFVGAWDVANQAADLVLLRIDYRFVERLLHPAKGALCSRHHVHSLRGF